MNRNPKNALKIRDLSVRIPLAGGMLWAVNHIDLDLVQGETLGLVGESGSGKSMTAHAIMGLLPQKAVRSAACIELAETDLLATPEKAIARDILGRRIGMIFQEPMTSLNPVYTIQRQLCETMRMHQAVSIRQAEERAIYLLEKVGLSGARSRLGQYPHQLSGGQRQRVMIAMALMNEPELLIADEPTTALDVTIQAQILHLLIQLQKEFGMSMILITHDLGVVSRVADQVAVMYAGRIVENGTVLDVLDKPHHPYTAGLLQCVPRIESSAHDRRLGAIPGFVPSMIGEAKGCSFAPRCARAAAVCRTIDPPRKTIGRKIDFLCHDPAPNEKPVRAHAEKKSIHPAGSHDAAFISIRQIEQAFTIRPNFFKPKRILRAVDNVSLDIHRGEVIALVGESGCGKTTLARVVLGLQRPNAGNVLFDGKPLAELHNLKRARLIQPIFQDPFSSLNPRKTIGDIIQRPLEVQHIGDQKERFESACRIMEMVGMPRRYYYSYPSQLSGGQRQRAAIARAIILKPEVVICDEPTSALDVSVQSQILNLLLDLRDELNLTYLFISHNLSVVGYMANRIAVMYLGQIVELGDRADVIDHPQHPYTRGLLRSSLPIAPKAGIPAIEIGQGFPNPLDVPSGCRFHPRCGLATANCRTNQPGLAEHRSRWIRCFEAGRTGG